jgi:hypothetical protein
MAAARPPPHHSTLLLPKKPRGNARRNEDWKLFLNTEVEVDL